jgi:hypothetical protein
MLLDSRPTTGRLPRRDASPGDVLVLTRRTPLRNAAERAALRVRIATEVSVLFVDEESLLALHLPAELGEATAWVAEVCEVGVISMGEDGVVLIRGREQLYASGGFAGDAELYARGFVSGLRERLPLAACAVRGEAYAKGLSRA